MGGTSSGGVRILISTTGYPIGALLEEFNTGASGGDKIFQPHVPGEPSPGPSFGEARFIRDGMDILFLAATNASGGNYDYNVYSMSDVTGSNIKQLTRLKGMTTGLNILQEGKATFVNGGVVYVLDIDTQTAKPL
jgi:AraC-like DNA-binding protein